MTPRREGFWRRWIPRLGFTVFDQGVVAGAHFFLQLALARWLTPSLYGIFALAFTVLLFLMGIHSALLAEPMSVLGPARYGKELLPYLRSTWRLQVRFGIVTALGAAGLALAVAPYNGQLGWALGGLVPAAPAFLAFLLLRRACYVLSRPRTALAGSALYAAVVGSGLLWLHRVEWLSPASTMGVIAVGGGLATTWIFRRLDLRRAPAGPERQTLWRDDWEYGRWMLAANLAHWGGNGVYLFFVAALVGLAEAGTFRALQNLITPAQQVLTAIGLLWLPWLAGRRASSASSGLGTAEWLRLWGPVVAMTALYGVGLTIWAPELLELLYGQVRYVERADLLAVFGLFAVITALLHGLTLSLRSEERTEPVFWSKMASSGVALVLGLGLTVLWGLPGAVWGLVLSVTAECAVLAKVFFDGAGTRMLRRLRRAKILLERWVKYLLSTKPRRLAWSDFSCWVRTTLLGRELVSLDLPWLCFSAARFLETRLEPGWRVLEWGSGASTLFFARRGCRVTSIEHDSVWAERVQKGLEAFPEAEVVLISETDPDYVGAADRFPPASLDLVVVDGRKRCDCLERARSRVRPGGWLVLDDSERERYCTCLDRFSEREWEIHHCEGPRPGSIWPVFSRTTCLRRRSTGETRS